MNERRRVLGLNGSLYIVIYCVFVLYLIVIFVLMCMLVKSETLLVSAFVCGPGVC